MFPGSRESQLPFGWVCFSNPTPPTAVPTPTPTGLNCLSAGSVSLTSTPGDTEPVGSASQLPFGWVCFSNPGDDMWDVEALMTSQLPFGWVCFSNLRWRRKPPDPADCGLNCLSAGSVSLTVAVAPAKARYFETRSQLPFGWVCFSNMFPGSREEDLL